MATFIMLTRLSHEGLKSPASLADLTHDVMEHIRKHCPEVVWKSSYVVLGPTDYLDIFTAPDLEGAMRVATVIRTFGHATTEIWGAVEWTRYLELSRYLPPELAS